MSVAERVVDRAQLALCVRLMRHGATALRYVLLLSAAGARLLFITFTPLYHAIHVWHYVFENQCIDLFNNKKFYTFKHDNFIMSVNEKRMEA